MSDHKSIDVRYVAQLARLELSADEVSRYQTQLDHILEHVEQLNKIDISGVEPTAHAFPRFNVFRDDILKESFIPEKTLSNAPRESEQQFIVPKIIE